MKSTFLILFFAIAAILALFEVNAEPLAEPLANPLAEPEADPWAGRPPGFSPFRVD
uniref:Vespakinin T n=1 Tax=Vespa tropica TaxID=7450 RepID=D3Y4D7_VESTR|nr:vespakinin T precursor [Vespa tropica]